MIVHNNFACESVLKDDMRGYLFDQMSDANSLPSKKEIDLKDSRISSFCKPTAELLKAFILARNAVDAGKLPSKTPKGTTDDAINGIDCLIKRAFDVRENPVVLSEMPVPEEYVRETVLTVPKTETSSLCMPAVKEYCITKFEAI